ncbi:uncharacterized protein LOC125668336 [Ostrea edulis]|uniref:uncharacterized protein LOC125668336 n=1 Tax=Ostrea edulis TaxID=37623 RepID=UPI0024AEC18B|nr:uncharacterized protein LOC125668336 [Ostrea edulis]
MQVSLKNFILMPFLICCFVELQVTSRCVNHPHYVSQWTSVEAQNKKQPIALEHECGDFPAKVEIQIRPTTGNWTNFYFPGIASSQRDDDLNITYGGIAYKYNKDEIRLFIPSANDGYPTGTIIYTGGSMWRGPVSQNERRAEVRALVWCPENLPTPKYESQWIPLYNSGIGSFLEISHNQGMIPDLVTLQIRQDGTEWLTDGIGSMTALGPDNDTSWGGVIYGYNRSHVRIWAPCRKNGQLFSADDGWGSAKESWSHGRVRIKVWRVTNTHFVTAELSQDHHPDLLFHTAYDQSKDLLIAKVWVNTGNNAGFLFPISGAVQNDQTVSNFGGIICSASNATMRIWTPVSTGPGYLLYINQDWGNSMYPQSSKKATLIVQIWQSSTCENPATVPPQSTPSFSTSLPQQKSTKSNQQPQPVETSHILSGAAPTTNSQLPSISTSVLRQNGTASKRHSQSTETSDLSPALIPAVVGGSLLLLVISGLVVARILWKRQKKNRVDGETRQD